MKILTETVNRLASDSPKFFRKLQYLGLYLTASATAVLAVDTIPQKLQNIASYVLTVGLVIAAVSKLPVKDPDYSTLDKKQDEKNN